MINRNKESDFLHHIGFKDAGECIDCLVELYTCDECVLTEQSIHELIKAAGVDISTEEGYNTITSILDNRTDEGKDWYDTVQADVMDDSFLMGEYYER